MAHAVGVSVEGELGCLGSLETEAPRAKRKTASAPKARSTHSQLLTDPEQAADFVARTTGVDALAIAIGTGHGAYKFTRQPTVNSLAIDRIAAIHAKIPNAHLVMHGGSRIPQERLEVIRENGGDMKETYSLRRGDGRGHQAGMRRSTSTPTSASR